MTNLLHRLGRLAYRRRAAVLASWLALLAALGGAAAAYSGKVGEEYRVPGTEAQETLDRITGTLPEYANASGRIVLAAPHGERLDPRDVRPVVREAAAAPGVARAVDPFEARAVSPDGRVALVQVVFDRRTDELGEAPREAVRDAATSAAPAGLRVEFGGDAFMPKVEVGGVGEIVGVGVAVVVLLITFGSLVAAGLPLLSALAGVGVGMAGLYALTGPLEIISTAPVLALMLGTAVGIDYALFVLSRYRQNLAAGLDPEDATARAAGTAGGAVVFAGATVVVALAGLAVADVPFLTVMGLSAAGAVIIAVLAALTLLPALLGFAGRAVTRFRVPGLRGGARDGAGFGARWARFVVRRPVPVLLGCLAIVGIMAVPAHDLRLGLPGAGSFPESTTARQAAELTAEGFGPGFNGPLIAVVDGGPAEARRAVAHISALPDVAAVLPPGTSRDGRTAAVTVIPEHGPDSEATGKLVEAIRAEPGVAVTGTTAANIDISQKLRDALPPFLAVITVISLALLTLAFRSVLVPVKAVAGFLLSVAASLGAVVAVYQWGRLAEVVPVNKVGPIASFLPILLISVLFGLAMDYQVFLVSRMREEHAKGADARTAVVAGFADGARVVTAAALIMIAVFGGFVASPDPIVQAMGFALAVGVAVDAFVVRMGLVPAVMALLGRAAWWFPRPLDRIVPRVDLEGTETEPAREPEPART
ncbi:MMPL family transporter [Actinomadura algeriensis]|uniref:RND superfamily putative drug exporter n=1 Tax=Actinomadura algeriensis TaxID=1679523 RepID=A0ABR9JKK9_9ACTN|nr:MMPL family transporter [Actinomadura algeriensis]MBE1531081.1 RND superfamily putative drug exporter [Actinomadura algeriensis]